MISGLGARLSMLLVVAVGLFSCSGRNVDYARVIPQEVKMVAALELRDLYKKSDLTANELSEYLQGTWAGSEESISLLRDGNSIGIATDYPVYFFALPEQADSVLPVDSMPNGVLPGDEGEPIHDSIVAALDAEIAAAATDTTSGIAPAIPYEDMMVYEVASSRSEDVAFVAKVSDRAKLEEAIAKSGLSAEDPASASYSLYYLDDTYIAVDDERVVVTSRGDLLPSLMAQDKETSFISSKGFEKMEKTKGDIRLTFSTKALMDEGMYNPYMLASSSMPLEDDLMKLYDFSKIYWIGSLAFESGKAVLDVVVHSEDKNYSATIEQAAQAMLTPSGVFSKFFAKESLFFANISFGGSRLVDVLERMKTLDMLRTLSEVVGIEELPALLSSVKGDVTLGMSDIDVMTGTSDFRVYAQLESEAPFRALVARLEQGNKSNEVMSPSDADSTDLDQYAWSGLFSDPKLTKVDDNNYVYQNGILSIGISFKDNLLGLSLQAGDEAMDKIWEAVSGDDITDQPLVKSILDKNYSFVYNNLATLSSPALAPVLAFVPRNIVAELRKISGLRTYTISETEQRVELLMVDEKTNALEQLLDIATTLAR